MGIRDDFDKVVDNAKDAIANVKDAANEATHRGAAEAEQTKRDVAGNHMTAVEKAGSMLNQAKDSMQANIDAVKRDARNNT